MSDRLLFLKDVIGFWDSLSPVCFSGGGFFIGFGFYFYWVWFYIEGTISWFSQLITKTQKTTDENPNFQHLPLSTLPDLYFFAALLCSTPGMGRSKYR